MKKIFLLGVGCQKGGTTWVHRYLSEHPNVNLGFKKEYHVFDGLYIPGCEEFRTRNSSFIRKRRVKIIRPKYIYRSLKFRQFYSNIDSYFDYFDSRVSEKNNVCLTGDITPEYSGLPAEVLQLIRAKLEDRGFDAKVIFLMRDPVERCISAVRMMRRNSKKKHQSSEEEDLLELYSTWPYTMHTQYENTITNIEQAFSPSQIYYSFYESLFTPESISHLTEFLTIPYKEPDFQKRYNVSKTSNVISDEARRTVYDFYAPTYEFVANKFGNDLVESIWLNHKRFENSTASQDDSGR